MKKIRLPLLPKVSLFIFLSILSSCNDDEGNREIITETSQKQEKIIEEISFLVAKTLNTQEVRKEISKMVEDVDNYGNAISFALLFDSEDNSSPYEKRKMKKSRIAKKTKAISLFKKELDSTFEHNKEVFKELSKEIETTKYLSSKNSGHTLSELENYIINSGLEIYFPYKENFNWDKLETFTVTYENNNIEDKQIGIKYHLGKQIGNVNITDDYLYENPTIAIIPIDEDYLGKDVKITSNNNKHYIDPKQPFEELYNTYQNIYNNPNLKENYSQSRIATRSVQRERLTNNINSETFFNNNYVLTAFIPKVKITNRRWKRWLSKAHRTRIARTGADVTLNPDEKFTATSATYYFDFDLSARELRRKNWKDVNIMFDPNWHKVKGSQQLLVWTKRSNGGEHSTDVKFETKIDAQGNFTPSASISSTAKTGSGTGAVFRGNQELDRNQILTTVINGSEYSNETFLQNGVNLSVRRVSDFYYFFDFYYVNF